MENFNYTQTLSKLNSLISSLDSEHLEFDAISSELEKGFAMLEMLKKHILDKEAVIEKMISARSDSKSSEE